MSDDKQLPQPLPFAPQQNTGIIKASERVEMQRASAEVYAAFQMARQFPRDEQVCFDQIMELCKNVHFCSDAMFKIPNRGEGLTIKAAKSFARIWKNLFYGSIEHGAYGTESQMESYCYDMESNVSSRTRYTVSHIVKANNQLVTKTDPADIDVLCKARGSKEVRNSILNVIPDYIEEMAKSQIKRTLHSAVSDIPAAFKALVTVFAKIGVNENSLWRYISKTPGKDGYRYEKVDAADIVDLRWLKDAIREEPEVADEVFPERDKKAALPTPPKEAKNADPKSQKTSSTPSPTPSKSSKEDSAKSSDLTVSTSPPKNTKIQAAPPAQEDAPPLQTVQEQQSSSEPTDSSQEDSDSTQEAPPETPPKKVGDLF